MRVRAIKSFSGLVDGKFTSRAKGSEFDLPAGCDWLRAGMVEVVNVDISPEVQAAKNPLSRVGVVFTDEQKAQIEKIVEGQGASVPIVRKPARKRASKKAAK